MLNGLLVALVVVVLAKEPGRVHVETEGSTGVAIVGTVKVLDQHVGDLVGLVALVTTGIQFMMSYILERYKLLGSCCFLHQIVHSVKILINLHARVKHSTWRSVTVLSSSSPGILEVKNRLVPDSRVVTFGTGLNLTVHAAPVVKGEWPTSILKVQVAKGPAGHGAIIEEALILKHLELVITAALSEKSR